MHINGHWNWSVLSTVIGTENEQRARYYWKEMLEGATRKFKMVQEQMLQEGAAENCWNMRW